MSTKSEIFAKAIEHHQSGRLQDAEPLYRQILLADPDHADALHLLGVIAHQVGNHDAAIRLIGRSLQLTGDAANVHNNLGGVFRAVQRFSEANACYRRAIEIQPDYAEAWINLGHVLNDMGQAFEAIACFRHAVELKPNFAMAQIVLGNSLRDQGLFDEVVSCYRRAIELQPDDLQTRINLGNIFKDLGKLGDAIDCYQAILERRPEYVIAHLNLGVAFKESGRIDDAISCYRKAIEQNPDFAEAYNNLGVILNDRKERKEAIACFLRALTLNPKYADAYNNMGNAYYEEGNLSEAITCYRMSIDQEPTFAKAYCNLGTALKSEGKLHDAVSCYRQALEMSPNYADAYNSLGVVLKLQGKLDDAIACCHRAIELEPDFSQAFNHLGNALKDQGRLDEALDCYQRAVELDPNDAIAHSNLIYTRLFCPESDRRKLRESHHQWNERHARCLSPVNPSYLNDRDIRRRLRIGYVSPDFRNHVIGRNLAPLFRSHDHRQFEIICYADILSPDDHTQRFQNESDRFCNTIALSDVQLADRIRNDQIDILIDLTLHLANNRLLVFARRPAPIQVTFAGYPGTTGLKTIDYRLTDPFLDPPGLSDDCYSEKSIRLPNSFWCYDPFDDELEVNSLPASDNDYVTFGCLNNFCKVNKQILEIWAKCLNVVKGSRLILMAGEGSHRQQTLQVFLDNQIDASRIQFVSYQPRQAYLKCYHKIDIGLDTVPYNGHSTSLDSFWMGVPVVTLVGTTVVGRAGLSQLKNLDLSELIAETPEQLISIVKDLAEDRRRLSELRATLRQRMQSSPLMDATGFTRGIETVYRELWMRWCAGFPESTNLVPANLR